MGSDLVHSSASGRRRSGVGWIGAMVSAAVLALLHLVATYLLVLAYAAGTVDPWERDVAAHSGVPAGLAMVVAALSVQLTWVCVRARWLNRWWYAPLAVLATAAFLRLTLLTPDV